MVGHKDLYEILGVPRNATQEEIRKAYLKLAHKYHPDKTGGDKEAEEKLKEINAAYDILKNPEKRAQYDRMGTADGPGFGGGGGFSGFGGFGGFGDDFGGASPFEDLFDIFFGGTGRAGRRSGTAARPGADLEYGITISLEDAARGARRKIAFNRKERCADCNGSGAAKGSRPETCSTCGGTGQVRATHGFFSITQTCPRCRGTGRVISNPCRSCSGSGMVMRRRELEIDIPAGVDDGQRLRVAGEGEEGVGGGPRGDLFVLIRLAEHPIFRREGTTIYCEVPITMTQAILGGTITVPTLFGPREVKIPAGTESGSRAVLRVCGMPDIRGYRQGDHIVIFQVELPRRLSPAQRRLLEEFERETEAGNYPKAEAFRSKYGK
ncbi:MAG TPA: molecular chaperone DnaJ [Candidatus Hydrogenedentes bacterium]|nr:molecular chaperone DnaJ [Candidatus Hydrogenedentota bacterium]